MNANSHHQRCKDNLERAHQALSEAGFEWRDGAFRHPDGRECRAAANDKGYWFKQPNGRHGVQSPEALR